MGRICNRVLYGALMAIGLSSCFSPGSVGTNTGNSCSGNNFYVYGKWKLIKGYPENWGYGGANPTKEQLVNDFRVMMIERGQDMCVLNILNQALQTPPVFRMKYSHDIDKGVMQLGVFWNGNTLENWQKHTVTYKITGCTSDNPQLTVTYLSGHTETYEVFSRTIEGGDCGNPTNPSGS